MGNVKVTISVPAEVDEYVRANTTPRTMGNFYAACVRLQMNPEPGKGLLERMAEDLSQLVEKKGGKV